MLKFLEALLGYQVQIPHILSVACGYLDVTKSYTALNKTKVFCVKRFEKKNDKEFIFTVKYKIF